MRKMSDTLVLAHYYTIPEVQEMADFVGDSLELSRKAAEIKPKRIVFAGVRFMAETAKILSPKSEVIIPDIESTCSLVEDTDSIILAHWVANHRRYQKAEFGKDTTHIMYINSSAEMKALADIIVTSANVEDVVRGEIEKGNSVFFSPDYNMGRYLNKTNGWDMGLWNAVCEVHDKFKAEEIDFAMKGWTDGPKFLLAHPESPLPVLEKADLVGSTSKMLKWVEDYPHKIATIFVATEDGLLYNMRKLRPELDIRQAPTYSGCQCNSCPYMKMNTVELVKASIEGTAGQEIDYLSSKEIKKARKPLDRMLNYV